MVPKTRIIFGFILGIFILAGGIFFNFTEPVKADWIWDFVSGSSGLNWQSSDPAVDPAMAVYNSELYVAWTETISSICQIRVKKYNSLANQWTWVDGGAITGTGINYNTSRTAQWPSLIVFNGYLYAIWSEYKLGVDTFRICVKKYDGTSWTDAGPNNLENAMSQPGAYNPIFCIYNNTLYAAWTEKYNNISQLRVKKYDGGTSWSIISNNVNYGLNNDVNQDAVRPKLTVWNNKMYVIWMETITGGIKQIHLKRYDGDTTWVSVEPSGGLKYTANDVLSVGIINFDSMLYAYWIENNLVRIKSYNGSAWSSADNNIGFSQKSGHYMNDNTPAVAMLYNNKLYFAWGEDIDNAPYPIQIRAAAYNHSSVWSMIDGNSDTSGLNKDSSKNAYMPSIIEYNGALYIAWHEDGGVNQIMVRTTPLPPITTSVSVPIGLHSLFQHLNFTVRFNKPVTVTGTPYIPITLDSGGTINANYEVGSGTNALVFGYTVLTGHLDTDGITLGPNIVLGSGASIVGQADGLNAELNLNNVAGTLGVTVDGVVPTVTSYSPLDNATGVSTSTTLTLTFNENMAKGAGYVRIYRTSDDVQVDEVSVSGANVTVNNNTVTIVPTVTLAESTGYYIGITSGAFRDTAGNNYAGTTDKMVWNFVTVDTTPPMVSALSPLDNALNIGLDDSLIITFSENIVKGTGNITIMKTADDSLVEAIDVAGVQVTVNNNIVTVNPAATLAGDTGYYILIDATAFDDTAGNSYTGIVGIGNKTVWNFTSTDMTAPTLVSAARTNDTTITVTLSENCINLTKTNNGGFTVFETGAPGVTYTVSSIAQGADAGHVLLTVANMAVSAREGVTVKYTAGGNGTIQDTAGNALTTNGIGVGVAAWDTAAPTIISGNLVASNKYIDINLSEGIYGASIGSGAASETQLNITFVKNTGTATGAAISSVKKPNSEIEASAAALTGGETTIRVFLSITGNPSGAETVAIKPANGTSLYDRAGNAMSALQTTGAKTLNPVTLTLSAGQILTETNLATTDIIVDLGGVALKDNQLTIGNFHLTGAPGLTIQSATYVDSVHCALRVSGSLNGNLNMGLTIDGAEISNDNPLTSGNNLTITDDLPEGKATLTIGTGGGGVPDNTWYTAENYQNDYRTVWSANTLNLGKGASGRNADLWLYNPGLIGNQPGQIPTNAKVDRAELILRIKNISGELTKPRQIKIYRITDPDGKGKPYFGSQDGIRTGLDFLYRDHRLGRNIPWSGTDGDITTITTVANLLDTFEFIPQAYVDGKYNSVRLDISDAVKAWVGNTNLNQGLYLTISGDWNNSEQVGLYGPAATNTSYRPRLQVSYLTTGDGSAPAAVTSMNVTTLGDQRVVLGWTNPAGATGCRVIRKEGVTPANPGDGTLLFDGNVNSFNDDHKGAENGKIYYYAVYAYNADRNYSPKAYKRAIPGNYAIAPTAPTGLTYTLTRRNVNLSWTDNAINENEYRIFRDGGQIATVSANQTKYYDQNVAVGQHSYEVRAWNTSGSNFATVGPVNVPNLPNPPGNLRWSVISSSEVQLYWTQVAGETYRVEILSESGALLRSETATVDLNSAANLFQYSVMRLTVNIGYRFRVTAVNGTGENVAETEIVRTEADSKPIFF